MAAVSPAAGSIVPMRMLFSAKPGSTVDLQPLQVGDKGIDVLAADMAYVGIEAIQPVAGRILAVENAAFQGSLGEGRVFAAHGVAVAVTLGSGGSR